MEKEFRILNIVSAKIWGGGEQYVYDVSKALGLRGCTMFTAINKNDELMHRRFSEVSSVFTTRLHTLNGLFSLYALTRFIRKNRISHLMIHTGKIAALSILLKKLTGVRLIFVKHNVVANKTDFYHRLIQKNTDRFICVSRLVYDVQTADNPFKEKYRIVHNGIDTDRFPPSQEKPDSRFFTVAYAGRISPEKGLENLIEACVILHRKYPQIRLKLAGHGHPDYMCRLKQNVSASGAEPFVSFEGFTEKLASFYRQSDVVVLPSLVLEAFGLSLCEAMYCQTAVISNTLGAQKEIIEHHQSGILLDRLTPESLADEIEHLVLNPETKNALATAGHQCVANCFTINHTADKLLDAI